MSQLITLRELFLGKTLITHQKTFSHKNLFHFYTKEFAIDFQYFEKCLEIQSFHIGNITLIKSSSYEYEILEGEIMITKMLLLISNIYFHIHKIRSITQFEMELYEDLIKRNYTYKFVIQGYDQKILRKCFDKNYGRSSLTPNAHYLIKLDSFYQRKLEKMNERNLIKFLNILINSSVSLNISTPERKEILKSYNEYLLQINTNYLLN